MKFRTLLAVMGGEEEVMVSPGILPLFHRILQQPHKQEEAKAEKHKPFSWQMEATPRPRPFPGASLRPIKDAPRRAARMGKVSTPHGALGACFRFHFINVLASVCHLTKHSGAISTTS